MKYAIETANHGQYPTIMYVLQQCFSWHIISALTEAKVFGDKSSAAIIYKLPQ